MFNELYKKVITKNPDDIKRKHYGRVNKRLIVLKMEYLMISLIICIINGKKYSNIIIYENFV